MKRNRFIFKTSGISAGSILLPFTCPSKLNLGQVSAATPSDNNSELIYNGIRLDNTWPPEHLAPESVEPMPVPYLKEPPKVIPIDIGRQLFVDDILIQETNLIREYHLAEKYESNPVFTPLSVDEIGGPENKKSVVYTGHGGVFYDWEEDLYKMFYRSGWLGGLALAISKDMIRWERPDLGIAGGNLILPKGHVYTGEELLTAGSDNSVWLDMQAPLSERLKYLTCWMHAPVQQRPKHTTHTLHLSDGKTWSNGRPTGKFGDYCSFFFNPFRNKWVYSIRVSDGPRGRCRYYSEHSNFLKGADWSDAVYWTNTDRLDQPEPKGRYPGAGETPQLYSLSAIAYESILIGMHQILRGPDNAICDKGKFPKLTDLEVGYSRDGFHWHRPDRRAFISGERKWGAWDRAYLHSTTGVFVVSRDHLIFPYTGFSGLSADGSHGSYSGSAIGLAHLRRDGFASMVATSAEGILITRPVTFSGKYLFVNATVPQGKLQAEIRDGDNVPIAPFTLENSLPFCGDSTVEQIHWKNGGDLSVLKGKPVRIHFRISKGSIYAFWISQKVNGSSGGYMAAGGKGYNGGVDNVGNRIPIS